MRTWVLGSGSRGNAVLLEAGESRVLVDAGFPVRTIADRLAAIGVACESIEALVVTHEHADHVRGACAAARRWEWQLYATAGTLDAFPELREADARTFEPGATLRFTQLSLYTVPTPHDAADPVAVVAADERTGARAGVAYDLGHVTPALRTALSGLDVLVLEANHDEAMLRAGPYPSSVQHRIAGRHGHLSNDAAASLARECAHGGLTHVVLAHLSDQCNDRQLAHAAVSQALRHARANTRVSVAPQEAVVGPFAPATRRMRLADQLSLGL